jgi:putative 4-mercaptohistidine N1-methyltranferase
VHPLYDDFATPTFDGKHTVFKGGSWISMGANGATADSRYSFRRHFFQHAGIRYVESDNEVDQSMNLYETDPMVLKEIDSHYPEDAGLVAGTQPFAKLSAAAVTDVVERLGKTAGRVLDLGCSVGRRTFELASTFDECVGIDRTARYIKAAVRLQDGEMVRYTVPMDGSINSFHEVSLKTLGMEAAAGKVQFWQNDAQNLDAKKFGDFDVVVAANVIEQLAEPKAFLAQIHEFVKPGGLLVLSSTYNWDEDVTASENMIGGYKCPTSGENVSTVAGVEELLKGSFVRVESETSDIAAVQRSTLRSMQYDLAEMTVWERL